MMKYTYRNECMISGRDDMVVAVLLVVLICSDFVFYLVGLVTYLRDKDRLFLVCGACVTIIALGIAGTLKTRIKVRRRVALARRYKALECGIRCEGKIVDAGMEMQTEEYRDKDENDNMKTYYRKVPNYWIDVEYREPQSGKLERTRAAYMVRSMEHLIGYDVGVYIWLEWSDYAQMNFTESYVDTYDL